MDPDGVSDDEEETPAAGEERYLGVVEVDSGTLVIGDPTYLLPRAREWRAGVDYQAVLDAEPEPHAQPLAGQPVLLVQNFGGDGTFPVFGEFIDGELVGIHIDLDPPMFDEE